MGDETVTVDSDEDVESDVDITSGDVESDVDITAEMVYETPEYKSAVTESKKRLRRAQEAEARLAELEAQEPKPDTPKPEPAQPIDVDVISAAIANKVREDLEAENAAKLKFKADVKQIIEDTGLDPKFTEVISQTGNVDVARAQAEGLVASGLKFDRVEGGDGEADNPLSDILSKADARLGLPD